ncbi:restriction endonuclease (plasmid) [Cytobacillus firmus]|uniref:restriction endonuclease n=1 Tax=Cytobacillus firmus TaxID=1399 RepID=UPI00207920B7|nr:restriction endonuclease [Cytobacillus firmus]USK41826.1 restriction endonuclease [Cytobacillus firmus]
MLDVFTEEIELQIKQGLANLYWYQNDLKKAWIRSNVPLKICNQLFNIRTFEGKKLTKRELMDELYEETRALGYNKRLEISRNFVRILIEHQDFTPQNPKHRIDIAERYALKLKNTYHIQKSNSEKNFFRTKFKQGEKEKNLKLEDIQSRFFNSRELTPQKRGYELENIFTDLMKINNIPVQKAFKIEGEQVDGAIKYDSHYYLVELKWTDKKISQAEIASLFLKVEGKLEARGIMISMNGYSKEFLNSLPRGKELKVILLDGVHLTNSIYGNYTFNELLEFSIEEATLRSNIYCNPNLIK